MGYISLQLNASICIRFSSFLSLSFHRWLWGLRKSISLIISFDGLCLGYQKCYHILTIRSKISANILYVNMHQTNFEVAVRVLYGWIFPNHTHIMHFLDSLALPCLFLIFPCIRQNPYSLPVYIAFDNRKWIPIKKRLQIQVTRLVGRLHLICYQLFRFPRHSFSLTWLHSHIVRSYKLFDCFLNVLPQTEFSKIALSIAHDFVFSIILLIIYCSILCACA